VRDAREDDVEHLAALWGWAMRRGDVATRRDDIRDLLAQAETDPDLQVLVAECAERVAGAVCLRATEVTPINRERCVQAISPHVDPHFRGRGVGRALIEGAVAFAEARGIAYVGSAAPTSAREANRFLARLGLVAEASLRLAPTEKVRAKVEAQRPAHAGSSQVSQLIAARRSRRNRAATAGAD
jgi:ribosomal protein S18 acetylase RimI-like enzyme